MTGLQKIILAWTVWSCWVTGLIFLAGWISLMGFPWGLCAGVSAFVIISGTLIAMCYLSFEIWAKEMVDAEQEETT